MSVQVNRCYYHPDRAAVAVCSECGAGICRECAVKYGGGKILCYQCGNEYLRQEHKQYRKELKESGGRFRSWIEFIFYGIIGVLIVVTVSALDHYGIIDYPLWEEENSVLVAYMLFSIPFGYTVLSDRFSPKYATEEIRFIKWVLKLFISMIAGWILFPFFLIRFIRGKIISKKSKT